MTSSDMSFESFAGRFRWQIPDRYNIARDVCDRWTLTEPDRLAIVDWSSGRRQEFTYSALRTMADGLADRLLKAGIGKGDRVGVRLSQSAFTAAAHISVWKTGAISLPLSPQFGDDALHFRLADSGARAVITDLEGSKGLASIIHSLPELELVLLPGSRSNASSGTVVEAADTAADDPALLMYTSGTTGPAKGVLHAHRVLPGHLPGVEISHDLFPRPGDVIWTPADWSWIGGLLDVLMPGLHHGVPVVASRFPKFSPESAKELIESERVRCVFFPPTALRMLKAHRCSIGGLRTVACGGEPLGAEMLDWGRGAFGVRINEFYGQTECNMVVSSCGALSAHRPGWTGRPVPGHEVAVIDQSGREIQDVEGDIAIRKGTPVMMLRYWNRPDAAAEKFRGDWMLTGDRGVAADGYIRFVGRNDEVITSAGYRIGPAEIEDCLLTHDAVASAGVVGKPDPVRTEIVKAYVVLRENAVADGDMERSIRDHVRQRLARYAFPREVEFVDELPMTVTGKVKRAVLRERARAETRETRQASEAL